MNNFVKINNFSLARACVGIGAIFILMNLIFIGALQGQGIQFHFQFTATHVVIAVACVAVVSLMAISYSRTVEKNVADHKIYEGISLRLFVAGISGVHIMESVGILTFLAYMDIPIFFVYLVSVFVGVSSVMICICATSYFYFLATSQYES